MSTANIERSLQNRIKIMSERLVRAFNEDKFSVLDTETHIQDSKWLIDMANAVRDRDKNNPDYITPAPAYQLLYNQGKQYQGKDVVDRDKELVLQFATGANLFAECMLQTSKLEEAGNVLEQAITWCKDVGLVHYGLKCLNSRILVESMKTLNLPSEDAIVTINKNIIALLQREPLIEKGVSSDLDKERGEFKVTKMKVQNNLGVLFTMMFKLRGGERYLSTAEEYLLNSLTTTYSLDESNGERNKNVARVNSNLGYVYIQRALQLFKGSSDTQIFYNNINIAMVYLNDAAKIEDNEFNAELKTRRAFIFILVAKAIDSWMKPPAEYNFNIPIQKILEEAIAHLSNSGDISNNIEDESEIREAHDMLAPLLLKYM